MFRSRKRGREVPKAVNAKEAAVGVDNTDAAPASTERQQHPVAAFANTVHVDPVIKVREGTPP